MIPSIILVLVLVAAVVAAVVGLSRRARKPSGLDSGDHGAKRDTMAAARRAFAYITAFAGLLATLYAVAGLLAVAVATLTLRSSTLLGTGDVRTRTSFYLAALIVGLPLWLGAWLTAQRRAKRSSDERDARERLLFLATVFGVTSVVALFAWHDVLAVALTWPGPASSRPSLLGGIAAGARLLIYGGAWLAYARIGWRERRPRDADTAHDLAVYVLSGFALSFLVIGINGALRLLIGDLVVGVATAPALLLVSGWTIWGALAAWILTGGLIWAAGRQYDEARGGERRLRVLYLYGVLLVAAPAALGGGADTVYELLRKVFGYRATADSWGFLRDALPPLALGALFWAYHWSVMRRQADPDDAAPAHSAGAIAWPRRLGVALLALAGLGMVAPAFISILWLALDFALKTATTLSGPDWWRDQLSLSIAAAVVGAAAWLGAWALLQRAAVASPAQERTAQERRLFLGGIALVGGLAALGFTIAALWLGLRALLGDTLDASAMSTALKDLSAAVVLAALAVYHGLTLRQDLQFGPARRSRVRLVALLAPGAEDALAALRRSSGRVIDVVGYLAPDSVPSGVDLATLERMVGDLATYDGPCDNALLILRPDGGALHLYARHAARQAGAPVEMAPAPGTVVGGTARETLGPAEPRTP